MINELLAEDNLQILRNIIKESCEESDSDHSSF